MTCSVIGEQHALLLEQSVIPALPARWCVSKAVFVQDGASPHIDRCVKQVLRRPFCDDAIISRHIPTA